MTVIMAANVSEYINAGNIAARSSRDIQAAAIRSGSDLSKISKEAANQRIKSEIAARKASAGVVQAGMQGESRLKGTEMLLDKQKREAEANKSVRKAGAVAAAGVLVGDAIASKADMKDRKERTPMPNIDFAGSLAALDKEIANSDAALLALASPKPTSKTSIVSPDASKLALRDTIYFAEGTWDKKQSKPMYDVTFGYQRFDNSKPHPGTVIKGSGVSSSAHGAGQWMPDTWKEINNGINAPMTPENQDAALFRIAQERGGYDFTKPFADQASKLSGIWASIPNKMGRSQYNMDDGSPQPSRPLAALVDFYNEREKFYKTNS